MKCVVCKSEIPKDEENYEPFDVCANCYWKEVEKQKYILEHPNSKQKPTFDLFTSWVGKEQTESKNL